MQEVVPAQIELINVLMVELFRGVTALARVPNISKSTLLCISNFS